MKCNFIHRPILTESSFQAWKILIISLLVWMPFHNLYASDSGTNSSATVLWSDTSSDAPLSPYERRQRLQQLLHYIRKEAPNYLPTVGEFIRNPSKWAQENIGTELGLGFSKDPRSDDSLDALVRPKEDTLQSISGVFDSTHSGDASGPWASPYRDRDFLPSKNAMVMGINIQQHAFDDRVQFDIHPLYGHSWGFNAGYWGTEVSIGPGQQNVQTKPWAKIAVLNSNNPHSLMDNRHGIDLYSAVNVTEQLSLNAGVRQDHDTQHNDYVLLRWKIKFD